MLNRTWRIVLLAVIIGFTLWETVYSSWAILVAAVLLLVFEVGCKDCHTSSAPVRSGKVIRASKTSKKKRR